MSSGNLPPGVRVRDIPGNRPRDERFRELVEEVERERPEWSDDRIRDETLKRLEGEHR